MVKELAKICVSVRSISRDVLALAVHYSGSMLAFQANRPGLIPETAIYFEEFFPFKSPFEKSKFLENCNYKICF